MNEKDWISKLKLEGFGDIFIWKDNPGEYYSPHKHDCLSAHIILEGDMTIKTEKEEKRILKAGDRFDVNEGEVHEVWIGKNGSRYIVGRKYKQSL